MKSVIKLVEDDEKDAELYKEKLEISGHLMIMTINPRDFKKLSDYEKILFDKPAAIIVDYSLAKFSGVLYTGFELAEFLRGFDNKIPIFILTNYEEETVDNSGRWSVEFIIPKSRFKSQEDVDIHVKRILRAIGRYEDALSERTKQLEKLIDKKLSGHISSAEQKELTEIRNDYERIFSNSEIRYMDKIEKESVAKKDELATLKQILDELKRMSLDKS